MYELEGRIRHDLIGPGAVKAAQSTFIHTGPLPPRTQLHIILKTL